MSVPRIIFVPSAQESCSEQRLNKQQQCQQMDISDLYEESGRSRWAESPGNSSFGSLTTKSPSTPPKFPRRRRSNERERLSKIRRPIVRNYPKSLDYEEGPDTSSSKRAQPAQKCENVTSSMSLKSLMLKVREPQTDRKLSYSM